MSRHNYGVCQTSRKPHFFGRSLSYIEAPPSQRPGSPQGTRPASRPSGWRSERADLPCGPTGARGKDRRSDTRARFLKVKIAMRFAHDRRPYGLRPRGRVVGLEVTGAGAARPTGLPRCARPAPPGHRQWKGKQSGIGKGCGKGGGKTRSIELHHQRLHQQGSLRVYPWPHHERAEFV